MADVMAQSAVAERVTANTGTAVGQPLRIIVLTCDDPFGVPVLLDELLRRTREITAIVLAQWKGQDSGRKAVRKWLGPMGWRAFLRLAGRYASVRAKAAASPVVRSWQTLTVRGVAREHGVPVIEMADINAEESLAWFRAEAPDLVVSVACPQILREPLLELPPLGCINVHSGPLPRYRGMLPTFWVMLNGEATTAVTVHFMRPEIDAGEIILQRDVRIAPAESQHQLMLRCKRIGAELLAETFDRFRTRTVTVTPNSPEDSSYFSFPGAEDGRRFREAGLRWF